MDMFCPHCGAATDKNDKFCVICGQLLHTTAVCGACGEIVPIAAAFCPKCGMNFLKHPEMSIQQSPDIGIGVSQKASAEPTDAAPTEMDFEGDEEIAIEAAEEDQESEMSSGGLRLPPAVKWVLGISDGSDVGTSVAEDEEQEEIDAADETDEPPLEQDDESQYEEDAPGEEDEETGVGLFDKLKLSFMQRPRKAKKERNKRKRRPVSQNVEEAETEEEPLIENASQTKKRGLILSLLHRKKAKSEKLVDDTSLEEEDDDAEESKRKGRSFNRRSKVDASEQAAMAAFQETANYDGYYDDVQPVDYGENEEERGTLDVKALALVIAGLVVFCVVVIRLQSML